MAQITLQRKATIPDPARISYKLALEVTAAQGITKAVFVKQRLKNPLKATFEDVTVAVASPAQLEDFPENSPNEGDSYFRSTTAEFISSNPDYLEEVYVAVQGDIQRLVTDVDVLESQSDDETTIISS